MTPRRSREAPVVDRGGAARENGVQVPSIAHAWLAWPLLVALAGPRPLQAASPELRAATGPLAVPVPPVSGDMSEQASQPGSSDRSGAVGRPVPEDMFKAPGRVDPADASEPVPEDMAEEPVAEGPAPPPSAIPTTPRVPAPTAAIVDDEPQQITVAVGLGPSAPGSKPERAVVDRLERSLRAARGPSAQVRRLRAGAGEGRAICREHRDDLVILLEYLPDREDAVLLTRDCRLDRDLGIRGQAAAQEPDLVAALWSEHLALVRSGAKERKVRLSRKARTGLIAGGAIVAVGLAIALVLASSLRRDTVVIKVGP